MRDVFVSIPKAAKETGFTAAELRRMTKIGKLPGVFIGDGAAHRQFRVNLTKFVEMLENNQLS